ncbi:MAG: DUF1569 domain-containing protein [Bacteroidota bacterium]
MKSLFDQTTKQEIIRRVQSLTSQTQRQWGKMDVAQMLKHVSIPLGLALTNPKPAGTFMNKILGPLFKSNVVGPKPFKKNLFTPKELMVESEQDFDTQKQHVLAMLNRFTPDNVSDKVHPMFGKLTDLEWGHSQYKHFDHHLSQFGA